MSLENLLAYSIAALILIVIPGPSVLFTVGRALALGRRAGIVSVAGNSIGSLVLATLVALGVGSLVAASEIAFTIIKLVGAAYLVFLGVMTIVKRKAQAEATLEGRPQSMWRVFRQAIFVGTTNVKTLAFFVAILPQFAEPGAALPVQVQLEFLGLIFAVLAFASDSVWALVAGSARIWFARSPRRLEVLTATGGGMMILLGGLLALTRKA